MRYVIPLAMSLFCILGCQSNQVQQNADSFSVSDDRQNTRDVLQEMVVKSDRIQELGIIYFDYDQSNLTPKAREDLFFLSKELSQCQGAILVEGYTDHNNSDEYNNRLGYQRAWVVADFLRSCGVWEERMFLKNFGETRPNFNNFNLEEQRKNRCVVVRIFPQEEKATGNEANKAYMNMFVEKKKEGNTSFIPLAVTKMN